MNPSSNNSVAQPATTGDGANRGDPLLERMTSILRLASLFSPPQRRERRYSDADKPRSTAGNPIVRPDPVTSLGTDGSRQLRAPDEQSYPAYLEISTEHSTRTPHAGDVGEHFCSAAACSVVKVFQTTELLELIFNFLEFKDVLSLRTANRHCYSVVQESKHLRYQFFVDGQWRRPHNQFQLLHLNLPGLSIHRGKPLDLGQWIEVSFTPEAARRIVPEPKPTKRVRSRSIFEGLRGGLGTRAQNDPWPPNKPTTKMSSAWDYDDLLITQPPIVSMQAFIVNPDNAAVTSPEDEDTEGEPKACAKLWCDSGITLGFLAETAQSLLSGNDGPSNVREVEIVYKTILSFAESDQPPRKRSNKKTVFYI